MNWQWPHSCRMKKGNTKRKTNFLSVYPRFSIIPETTSYKRNEQKCNGGWWLYGGCYSEEWLTIFSIIYFSLLPVSWLSQCYLYSSQVFLQLTLFVLLICPILMFVNNLSKLKALIHSKSQHHSRPTSSKQKHHTLFLKYAHLDQGKTSWRDKILAGLTNARKQICHYILTPIHL